MDPDLRREHRAHRLAEEVYGTILATTVVVASAGGDQPVVYPLVVVVVTSVVFWCAHVYARTVARRMVVERTLTRQDVAQIARSDWPMLRSAVPVAVPLGLGSLGLIADQTAGWLAVLVGVGALFAYGFIIGVREDLSRWRTLLSATLTGSFGLVILGLKVMVH